MSGMVANKVIVITGATSGIGQAGPERLASMGARIIQIARDRTRGQAALERLQGIAPNLAHAVDYADLSSIADTKRIAAEIAAAEPQIDILINNAGAIYNSRQLTGEGLERTFALNHVAYFVLTVGLIDQLKRSSPARIVNTSSDAHLSADLDFADLQSSKAYKSNLQETLRYGGAAYKVYARSKLCNVLFTRELARRLYGTGVTVNCFHPGFVSTRFADHAGGLRSFSMRIAKRFARSSEKGAETLVFLASAPEVADRTGEYFNDRRVAHASPSALDEAVAQQLWFETSRLAKISVNDNAPGFDFPGPKAQSAVG